MVTSRIDNGGCPVLPGHDPGAPEVDELDFTESLPRHKGKGDLTNQELKFINLHVIWNVPVKTALILSGYPDYSEQHAFVVGRKIVSRYEQSAEASKVFIDLNFGPVEIARGIIDIARNCPNAQVRLNALALAAKCAGMLRDQIEKRPGVTIIIKGRDYAVPGAGWPAAMHLDNQPKTMQIKAPVAITR
jgi:hypothetical protein